MESKKQRARDERKTLNKAQEVHYLSEFKAADRAMARAKGNRL
ncbi:YfhE family protein [Anaerobacillus isosaccharinicus]|uniref:YfhE family protein n=1 Tax=Anaerobacillus isosaccharinicus TaxID=1532552 RepID=A0A7S7RCA0_9BACI|nr:YfhE family protein [Anaerobacillus isosaccharinicus]MBA5584916.1 YfhE family protein [Anaerobacillus isosaccharinicus]QOY36726.1 YfhE family protein [Anaerobacillus isosaccharinicus]